MNWDVFVGRVALVRRTLNPNGDLAIALFLIATYVADYVDEYLRRGNQK